MYQFPLLQTCRTLISPDEHNMWTLRERGVMQSKAVMTATALITVSACTVPTCTFDGDDVLPLDASLGGRRHGRRGIPQYACVPCA